MNIKFTPRAESEAEAKTRWWRRNRQSPDLFDDELAEALAAIRRDRLSAPYTRQGTRPSSEND